MRINVPARIKQKWCKRGGAKGQFFVTKALPMAKISTEEFRKCWKIVQPMIPDEELFRLLEKTFGPHKNLDDKVIFIKDIMRRYKAMGEPVCVRERAYLSCLCFVLCTV